MHEKAILGQSYTFPLKYSSQRFGNLADSSATISLWSRPARSKRLEAFRRVRSYCGNVLEISNASGPSRNAMRTTLPSKDGMIYRTICSRDACPRRYSVHNLRLSCNREAVARFSDCLPHLLHGRQPVRFVCLTNLFASAVFGHWARAFRQVYSSLRKRLYSLLREAHLGVAKLVLALWTVYQSWMHGLPSLSPSGPLVFTELPSLDWRLSQSIPSDSSRSPCLTRVCSHSLHLTPHNKKSNV